MRRAPLLLLAIAACAPTPPPQPAAPKAAVFAPVPGLERVIGQPASTATALLGLPGLDRSEGTARQLQFVRAGCVLDLFFYPDPTAGQPVARYADARRADGSPETPARCFAAQLSGRG